MHQVASSFKEDPEVHSLSDLGLLFGSINGKLR